MATYSFTIRATDSSGVYSDRAFSIVVNNTSIDRYIVLGTTGIVRSPDATTWTYDSYPKGHGILYANGKWIIYNFGPSQATAPTSGQYPMNWFYSSADGVNWSLYQATGIGTGGIAGWSIIKYRNGKYMGFTRMTSPDTALNYWESTDGIAWTKVGSGIPNGSGTFNGNEAVHDFEYYNGTYIALASPYQASTAVYKRIFRSTNGGSTWTWVDTSATGSYFTAGVSRIGSVTNVNGLWIVNSGLDTNQTGFEQLRAQSIAISYDGLTWDYKAFQPTTPLAANYGYMNGLTYYNGRLFLYSNSTSLVFYASSPKQGDTAAWTSVSALGGTYPTNWGVTTGAPMGAQNTFAAYQNRMLLCPPGSTGGQFQVSTNFGQTWTTVTQASIGTVTAVATRTS